MAWLAWAVTASRFAGSLAKASRRAGSQRSAPLRQASARATTWSICTSAERGPRSNATRRPVYGSSRVPRSTWQPSVSVSVRSRSSTSLRVSQPLWSVSAQADPNWARSYRADPSRAAAVTSSATSAARPAARSAADTGYCAAVRTATHRGTPNPTATQTTSTTHGHHRRIRPACRPGWVHRSRHGAAHPSPWAGDGSSISQAAACRAARAASSAARIRWHSSTSQGVPASSNSNRTGRFERRAISRAAIW